MKHPRLSTVYCLLLTCIFLAHTFFYYWALGTDAVDDAYISFRYAQNAIHGNGLIFNPGERVEGFTNFLWTAMTIPLEGAHMDVGRASMLIGALFGIAILWLVVRFAKSVGAPRSIGWLAALFLAVDGSFVLWSVSGLETSLFAFLVFAGAVLYVQEQNGERREARGEKVPASRPTPHAPFPYSGIFFALAAMTRPEGLFVFAITVAHQAAWRIITERRLFTARDILRGVAFGAIFAPYWLGRWWYYKSFLPNSFHAKVAASGPTAQIERGWAHLAQFVGVHLGWLIALPPVVAVLVSLQGVRLSERNESNDATKQSPNRGSEIASQKKLAMTQAFWTTYFAAIIIPYAAYIVYVGGDWSVGRFFVSLLPFFYLLFSTGLVELWKMLVERRLADWGKVGKYAGAVVSILLASLLFVASSWNGEYGIYIRSFDAGRATEARVTMGRWLKANVPHSTLIAVDAAGQVPYFSELSAIDMFGINDLHIGRLQVATLGQGTPGHEKFDLVYVITRQPEYVVIFGTLLDSVKEYERAPVEWTNDLALQKFLTLYKRKQ
jgi:arabinofuranosyltransferase